MSEEPNNAVNDFELALRDSLDAKETKVGDVIEGTIVAIHGDVALIDVAGKSEAILDRDELDDRLRRWTPWQRTEGGPGGVQVVR